MVFAQTGRAGMVLVSAGVSHPVQACQTEEGLSNVAAAAEQFQPKGITLATTEVSCLPSLFKARMRFVA